MRDPIERQEAIDAIANLTFNITIGGKRGFQDYKKEVEKIFVAIRDKYIEALKALPQAEPKQLTKDGIAISRNLCDSCINNRCIFQYGIVRNRCDFYKGMDTIIELPPAERRKDETD